MKYRNDLKYYMRDGQLLPVSQFDEGIFAQGESVYEVIRVHNGRPLFLQEHLARLQHSLDLAYGGFSFSKETLSRQTLNLIEQNAVHEGNLKIEMCRKNDDYFEPLLYFIPHRYPTAEQFAQGVKMKLQFDERTLPNAKMTNWDVRGHANRIIDTYGVYETLLVNSGGYITEGSRSNFFLIRDDALFSAPEEWILPGITRSKILEICRKLAIPVYHRKVHYHDLNRYDAAFITGTSPGVLQVRRIEEVDFEINHAIYRKIKEAFRLY
jgi:branched-chain amino acid aminotransferase